MVHGNAPRAMMRREHCLQISEPGGDERPSSFDEANSLTRISEKRSMILVRLRQAILFGPPLALVALELSHPAARL